MPTLAPPSVSSLALPLSLRHAVAVASWFCSRRLAILVMTVLAIGVTLSILTTPDHEWWRLHFSKLGTFADFSGYVFNGTLMLAGLIIVWFATRVRGELRRLATLHPRLPARTLPLLMASVGLNLLLVGVVPVNTNEFLHDRAASGLMASFLAILVTTLRLWRNTPSRLLTATIAITVGLSVVIVGFVLGVLNLAALEIVGFGMIFVWIGIFTQSVRTGMVALEEHQRRTGAPAEESAGSSADSAGCLTVVPRRALGTVLVVSGPRRSVRTRGAAVRRRERGRGPEARRRPDRRHGAATRPPETTLARHAVLARTRRYRSA